MSLYSAPSTPAPCLPPLYIVTNQWKLTLHSDGKESACNAEDQCLIPGLEDPQEKGMVMHFSILAWRIPSTEEPDKLESMGSQRVRHNWATNKHTQWKPWNLTIHHQVVKPRVLYSVPNSAKERFRENFCKLKKSCIILCLKVVCVVYVYVNVQKTTWEGIY